MKFAGHNNPDTFFGSYAPELSTVDGMASYWNKKRRTVHLEGFRGLSLHHHPQLLQSLPAKVEANLDNCTEFVSINKEIEILGERLRGIILEDETQPARARREELYWRKRQLVSEELSKWQKIQPRKIASNTEDEALKSRVCQATSTGFAVWIRHVIGWRLCSSSTFPSAVCRAAAHSRI